MADVDIYDLYIMASPGGALLRHQALKFADDDYAIAHAIALGGDNRIELWKDGQKLLAISGDHEPAQISVAPR